MTILELKLIMDKFNVLETKLNILLDREEQLLDEELKSTLNNQLIQRYEYKIADDKEVMPSETEGNTVIPIFETNYRKGVI